MKLQPRSDNAETIVDGLNGGLRPTPIPAPERIGAYRLEDRLGIGGMGEVFLAWDEKLQRRVAIKRIRQDIGLTPEQRERFRREAQLAARLSHPNVVQIHELVSDGPDDAIVMELIEGRTVEERLAAGRLDTAEVLRLAAEIAEGLAAAHEAGLIHRDLKAANILITLAGHAKILDFGLARPVVRAPEDQGFTRQGVILGTCHAMSPEQARGQEVDERSDLFSFGALVHEMLTGRPPFRGNDHIDSLRRVVTEDPVDPRLARPDLPAEAACLLRRLLAKDREKRPASAREVIEILERLRTAPSGSHSMTPEGSVSDFVTGGTTYLDLPVPFHGEAGGARSFAWTRQRMLVVGVAVVLLVAAAVAFFLTEQNRNALPISQEDLALMKKIEQRLNSGEKNLEQDSRQMDMILERNPRYAEAFVLASRLEHSLYQSSQEPGLLRHARELAQQARAIAPNDPQPRLQELNVTLEADDSEHAEALLKEFEAAWPQHPDLLRLHAKLNEQRGHWNVAAWLLSKAVENNPSSTNRYRLALLESKRGRFEEARKQTLAILKQEPTNLRAQEHLGYLELMHGDSGRAAQIYTDLLGVDPRKALNNLGHALLLDGQYERAVDIFQSALKNAPEHALTWINLADAKVELGQMSSAKENYQYALELLEKQSRSSTKDLASRDRMLRAQCLARLGNSQLAVEAVRAALSKTPVEPELLQQSALVFSLIGDQGAALKYAQAALERGLSKHGYFGGSTGGSVEPWVESGPSGSGSR